MMKVDDDSDQVGDEITGATEGNTSMKEATPTKQRG